VSREQIEDNAIVSNTRHYEALSNSLDALNSVEEAMLQGISSDLVASDIRQALYHLGTITGQIVNDDILDHIFKNFCIGK
jgi:tRNA modification GTPase